MLKIKDDVDLKVLKKFYSADGWRKIRNTVMNPIIIVRVWKKCEKEKRRMENNNLDIDEIAKTMANALKKLTEALGSFNEEKIKEILKQSIKPTLSEAEHIILGNIDKKFEWIARDEDGRLHIYTQKPYKVFNNDNYWAVQRTGTEKFLMLPFNTLLFQFVKWEDEQPYNIEELLKGE